MRYNSNRKAVLKMFDFFKELLNSKGSDSEYNLDNISEDELNFIDDDLIAKAPDTSGGGACQAKKCKAGFDV